MPPADHAADGRTDSRLGPAVLVHDVFSMNKEVVLTDAKEVKTGWFSRSLGLVTLEQKTRHPRVQIP